MHAIRLVGLLDVVCMVMLWLGVFYKVKTGGLHTHAHNVTLHDCSTSKRALKMHDTTLFECHVYECMLDKTRTLFAYRRAPMQGIDALDDMHRAVACSTL